MAIKSKKEISEKKVEKKPTNKSTKKTTKKTTVKKTPEKKTTTKSKYDWKAIKQEFFESDFIDVKPFLQSKYSLNTVQSGDAREKTKGWADEKKKIQEDAQREALKKFKDNVNEKWGIVLDQLEQAHIKGLEDLVEMVMEQGKTKEKIITVIVQDENGDPIEKKQRQTHVYRPILGHKDVIEIIKHIKLEKGEPTDIVDDGVKAKAWLDEMRKAKTK